MDDPYAELARVKARIAEMERYATAAPPLEAALADHYSPTRAPVDPARRRLEAEARQFVPDPSSEDALAARERDPAGYDSAMEAMHVSALPLSLYSRMRAAAVETGTWTPPTKEGASK
jgi:hypothetical protein